MAGSGEGGWGMAVSPFRCWGYGREWRRYDSESFKVLEVWQ